MVLHCIHEVEEFIYPRSVLNTIGGTNKTLRPNWEQLYIYYTTS